MWLLLIFFCPLLILVYFYKTRYDYWKTRKVPYEQPFGIFGNLYDVVTRKEHLFVKLRSIYERFSTPYVGIFFFHKPALLIRSPRILKKILVKDFDKFVNRNLARDVEVDPLIFNSLFFMKDDAWRDLRSKLTPAFTSSVKSLYSTMQECADRFCFYLSKYDNETVEMKFLMRKFSIDITASCALGASTDLYTNEDNIFKMADRLMSSESFIRSFSIFSYFFMHAFVNVFKLTFADKTATDYLGDIFKKTIKERKLKQSVTKNGFIESVIELEKNGFKYDSDLVVAQALTFFGAGSDTIAILLAFTFYELSFNEDVQNRLREEVRKVFDQNEKITFETIQDIKYLDMVVNETLRKYPLGGVLFREAGDDYLIEETGFTIDKGTNIIVPVSGLHYDPNYFPDPDKFNPERFSEENKNKIPNYVYLPFGNGPRQCIGQRFALAAIKISIANTIKDFQFEVTNETPKSLDFDASSTTFVQNKGGLYLKIKKCSRSSELSPQ